MTIMFFIVYAGFIACISFLTEATSRMNGARIAQRNPERACSEPALAERLRRRTLPVWLSRLAGAALLVALGCAAFAGRPLEAMTSSAKRQPPRRTTILLGRSVELLAGWSRTVPAPAKRQADLRSTRDEDHAPTRFTLAWYAAFVAALGLYAYAYFAETLPAGQAVARMLGISGVLLLWVFLYAQVRRQPAPPGQRKVGIAVIMFCLLCLAGRIAQDFFGAPQFNEVWLFFFVSLSLQLGLAVLIARVIRQARAGRPAPLIISAS